MKVKTPSILFLLVASFFTPGISTAGVHTIGNHRYNCEQDIGEIEDIKYQTSVDISSPITYYYKEQDGISIGDENFRQVSYLFWNGKYFGYIVYLNDKAKSFKVKQYIYNKISERIRIQKKCIPKYIPSNDRTLWETEDEIIIFKRFSFHQAKVIYLCRCLYKKSIDPPDDVGYFPFVGVINK